MEEEEYALTTHRMSQLSGAPACARVCSYPRGYYDSYNM
jgi:hypothetical protein